MYVYHLQVYWRECNPGVCMCLTYRYIGECNPGVSMCFTCRYIGETNPGVSMCLTYRYIGERAGAIGGLRLDRFWENNSLTRQIQRIGEFGKVTNISQTRVVFLGATGYLMLNLTAAVW